MDGMVITIDSWPFLNQFVEVEGPSEQAVQAACERLGLPYQHAIFGSIDLLYARQYGIAPRVITEDIPALTFVGANPLLRFSSSE
jgi:adenylate cyclase class 2